MQLREQRGVGGGAARQRRMGIHLGAFGWVEHVKPSSKRQLVREAVHPKLQPKDGAPLFEYTDNGGFVHAPSLNRVRGDGAACRLHKHTPPRDNPDIAAVEPVVRARSAGAADSPGNSAGPDDGGAARVPVRTRVARSRLSQQRVESEPLGVYSFRDQFPYEQHRVKQQGNDEPDSDYTPQESIAASNVVNGVKLAETSDADVTAFMGTIAGITSDERTAILEEHSKLADSLDAAKDLLLSESVYQLVQGNFDRTSATVNALQEARIPADLQVVETPRSSHFSFTNRVTLHFERLDPNVASSNPWPAVDMTPRAKIEHEQVAGCHPRQSCRDRL